MVLIVFRLAWGVFGTRYLALPRHRPPAARRAGLSRRISAHGRTGRYRGLNPAGTAMLVAMLFVARGVDC